MTGCLLVLRYNMHVITGEEFVIGHMPFAQAWLNPKFH